MSDAEFEEYCKTYKTETLEKVKNGIHVSDPFKLGFLSSEQQAKINKILKTIRCFKCEGELLPNHIC